MIIYIRLLNEGVDAYRPVNSIRIGADIYIVGDDDVCDAEDEDWEFPPGTRVYVEQRVFQGESESVLVAVSKV